MCLAIPGRVESVDQEAQTALIDYNGVKKSASILLLPDVAPGVFALVHAGFVIQVLEEAEGAELQKLTEECGLV